MPRGQLLFVVPQKVTKKGTKGDRHNALRASACPPWNPHHNTTISAAEGPPLSHGCAVPAAYCGRPLLSLCDISPTPWGNRPPKGEPRACGAVICIENRRVRNSATHLLHTNEQRRSRVLPPLGNSPVRGNVAKRQRGLLPLLRGSAERSEAKGGLATPPHFLRRRIRIPLSLRDIPL